MSGLMRGIRWHLEAVTAPVEEPMSVAFVRDQHLRSPNGDEEDEYIRSLIEVAREVAEQQTRRALTTQTHDLVLSGWPIDAPARIIFPKPPLQSVTSVTYIDADGDTQTWDSTKYQTSIPSGPNARRAELLPIPSENWPTLGTSYVDPVTARFVCGYVSPTSPIEPDVPKMIQQGMLLLIGELYKQRTESVHVVRTSVAVRAAYSMFAGMRVQ